MRGHKIELRVLFCRAAASPKAARNFSAPPFISLRRQVPLFSRPPSPLRGNEPPQKWPTKSDGSSRTPLAKGCAMDAPNRLDEIRNEKKSANPRHSLLTHRAASPFPPQKNSPGRSPRGVFAPLRTEALRLSPVNMRGKETAFFFYAQASNLTSRPERAGSSRRF